MARVRPFFLFCLVALLVLVGGASAAFAQPNVSSDLKRQGDTAFDQSRFAEAYDLYERAYAAYPDPALLYNQGRALESMGDYPEAIAKLEYFRTEAPTLAAKVQLDPLLAQLRSHLTTLTILTNVPSADLFVRGKALGKVERQRIISSRSGSADIELRAEGYETAKRVVELVGGDRLTVQIDLVPKAQVAVLAISSQPSGSDVAVDNRPIGPSPVDVRVPPGAHVVVVRHEGYDERTISLSVTANEHRDLNVELPAHRSILSRWYFWAGVGLVLAGGAVTAALLIEKPAEKGTFTPSQTRAPLMLSF